MPNKSSEVIHLNGVGIPNDFMPKRRDVLRAIVAQVDGVVGHLPNAH